MESKCKTSYNIIFTPAATVICHHWPERTNLKVRRHKDGVLNRYVPDIPLGGSIGIPAKLSLSLILKFSKKSFGGTEPLSATSFYGHAPHTISNFYFYYLFLYH